jgi:hypothetical protein
MLNTPAHAEAGLRFFRREYPRVVADHQRFLPLLRQYYADGGRPAAGASAIGDHIARLTSELDTLRRTMQLKLQENKRLRQTVRELAGDGTGGGGSVAHALLDESPLTRRSVTPLDSPQISPPADRGVTVGQPRCRRAVTATWSKCSNSAERRER